MEYNDLNCFENFWLEGSVYYFILLDVKKNNVKKNVLKKLQFIEENSKTGFLITFL